MVGLRIDLSFANMLYRKVSSWPASLAEVRMLLLWRQADGSDAAKPQPSFLMWKRVSGIAVGRS